MTTVSSECPYCGEPVEIAIDPTEGDHTRTEDCEVCCSPMEVQVRIGPGGELGLNVRREND